MKQIYIITIFSFLYLNTSAQVNNQNAKQILEDAAENAEEEINESSQNEIPDELMDLISHPINLNSGNLEIFVRYNLLSKTQLESFVEYRKLMGDLVELEELQQIPGFDKKTITTIIPYCTVAHENPKSRYQQIIFRTQNSLNKSIENYYGSPQKILFKYKIVFPSSIIFSYTGEKDAGEESFTSSRPGFDFNSFNISYRGNSFIRKIILGDFNTEFGQGLTAWTGLSYVSTTSITGIYKYGNGLVPYSGTDENRFHRGVAMSLKKNKIVADIWFSHHAIDGNLVIDSISKEEYITSLQTSGYHRTNSEMAGYHVQKETSFGSSLTFTSNNFSAGIITAFQHYNIPVIGSGLPYTKFEFVGKDIFNTGLNYSYSYRNILLFGETAYSSNNAFASINGLLLSLDPKLSLGILLRSYDKKYYSKKSNAYGSNSYNTNENGNYIGINYKLINPLIYSGFIDVYSFPFLKYRVDQPSYGFDFFQQFDFTPIKKFSAQIRYREKLKQLNDSPEISGLNKLSDIYLHSWRFSARFKVDGTWDYNIRLEVSYEEQDKSVAGKGTMISQDLFYHPQGKPYSVNFRYAVFNCPDFDTRIYEYENDVQGAFSIPFYYGKGSRFYINLGYKINRNINISLRYSITWIENVLLTVQSSELKIQVKTIFR